MTKQQAKKCLLRDLATILNKDDDLVPDDVDLDNPREYGPWRAALDELIEEFERRSMS